jgi:LysR family transcriptional regulator, nitrogen assimilation regulatory protein
MAIAMLDLRQLRYFVAIVDAGSVSRAANVLHIAQPALSQQLAHLERDVGARLLRRSVRGVTLTTAGDAVYRHAQLLLKLAAETPNVARGDGMAAASRRVRVGMPSSIAAVLVGRLVEALQKSHPEIFLEIHESPSTYLAAQLLDERVDLSLLVERAPSPPLAMVPLVSESVYFLHERRRDPLAAWGNVGIHQLAAVPLILTTGATTVRYLIDDAFRHAAVVPRVLAEANSIETLLGVVAKGAMGTLLPSSALSWHGTTRAIQSHLLEPRIERVASLAWSRSGRLEQSSQFVREAIVEVARALVASGKWRGATFHAGTTTHPG